MFQIRSDWCKPDSTGLVLPVVRKRDYTVLHPQQESAVLEIAERKASTPDIVVDVHDRIVSCNKRHIFFFIFKFLLEIFLILFTANSRLHRIPRSRSPYNPFESGYLIISTIFSGIICSKQMKKIHRELVTQIFFMYIKKFILKQDCYHIQLHITLFVQDLFI